jgi:hypothetical protein
MLSQFLFKRIKVTIDAISHNRRDSPIKQLADLNTSLLTSGARSIDLCWFGPSIVHSINQLIIDSFTRQRRMTHTRFHYIARLCLPEDGTFRRPGTVPIPSSLCVLLRAEIYRSRWWVYLRCLFHREHPIPLHLPQQGVNWATCSFLLPICLPWCRGSSWQQRPSLFPPIGPSLKTLLKFSIIPSLICRSAHHSSFLLQQALLTPPFLHY